MLRRQVSYDTTLANEYPTLVALTEQLKLMNDLYNFDSFQYSEIRYLLFINIQILNEFLILFKSLKLA